MVESSSSSQRKWIAKKRSCSWLSALFWLWWVVSIGQSHLSAPQLEEKKEFLVLIMLEDESCGEKSVTTVNLSMCMLIPQLMSVYFGLLLLFLFFFLLVKQGPTFHIDANIMRSIPHLGGYRLFETTKPKECLVLAYHCPTELEHSKVWRLPFVFALWQKGVKQKLFNKLKKKQKSLLGAGKCIYVEDALLLTVGWFKIPQIKCQYWGLS